MAWVDFYMQTTGNDLNAGSTNADAAVYTSTAGNFDGTSVFTPTDGSTPASSINVGDYVSLYNTGDTVARCVAQVTVVGAGVNGTVTISTTVKYGTVPTVNSGSRALKAGGAWASLAMLATNGALNTGTAPQSTRVNIKAGTYANTTNNRAFGIAGTTTVPVWYRGYKNTIGDQDLNNVASAGNDIPSLTMTTGQFSCSAHNIFSNIDFTGATTVANGLFIANASAWTAYRCRFTNTALNSAARALTTGGTTSMGSIVSCYMKATASADMCFRIAANQMSVIGCYITGGIIGAQNEAGSPLLFCVFDSQAGDAIKTLSGGTGLIAHCSIYNPTGNGINISATPTTLCTILNNYFENVNQAAKAAINNTSGTNTNLIRATGNAYFNCTSNTTGITESFTIFDNGTLSQSAFINPGSDNFAIGAVARSLGFPGVFENQSAYQGYLDVGAVQRVENVGGGVSVGF